MKTALSFAAAAILVFALPAHAPAASSAQRELRAVQYLVGTWQCAHTVGTFSGTYATTYSKALDGMWLKQTYDFPPGGIQGSKVHVYAEYMMGYDERRQAWVRFGGMSNGQYFAIRMTDTGTGWAWKYTSFFPLRKPLTPGPDATFTKRSNSEYAVDGPTYKEGSAGMVTEHHVCKKA